MHPHTLPGIFIPSAFSRIQSRVPSPLCLLLHPSEPRTKPARTAQSVCGLLGAVGGALEEKQKHKAGLLARMKARCPEP